MDMPAIFPEMHGDTSRAGCDDFLRSCNNVRLHDRRTGGSFVACLPERGDVVNIDAEMQHAGRLHCRSHAGNVEEKTGAG